MRLNKNTLVMVTLLLASFKRYHALIESDTSRSFYGNKTLCGSRLSTFYSKIDTPFSKCLKECGLRPMCKAVNYRRMLGNYCELLFNNETTAEEPGCLYISKEDMISTGTVTDACSCTKGQRCDEKSDRCSTTECTPFTSIEHGKLLGNRYSIGSILRLNCTDDYRPKDVSTIECMANGEWSGKPGCISVCPTGWKRYGTSCIYISGLQGGKKRFYESIAYCKANGGHLVQIETKDKHDYLRNEIIAIGGEHSYWIDLVYDAFRKSWYWSDTGTVTTYTYWGIRQPNLNHAEHFVVMFQADEYRWHDTFNYFKGGFICEKPVTIDGDK